MSDTNNIDYTNKFFGISKTTLQADPEKAVMIIDCLSKINENSSVFMDYLIKCLNNLGNAVDKAHTDAKAWEEPKKELQKIIPVVEDYKDVADKDIQSMINKLTLEQGRFFIMCLDNLENLYTHLASFLNHCSKNMKALTEANIEFKEAMIKECPEIQEIQKH